MASAVDPNDTAWFERLKTRLHQEWQDWKAMSWFERIKLAVLLAVTIGMFLAMFVLLYISMLSDPSGSAGM